MSKFVKSLTEDLTQPKVTEAIGPESATSRAKVISGLADSLKDLSRSVIATVDKYLREVKSHARVPLGSAGTDLPDERKITEIVKEIHRIEGDVRVLERRYQTARNNLQVELSKGGR